MNLGFAVPSDEEEEHDAPASTQKKFGVTLTFGKKEHEHFKKKLEEHAEQQDGQDLFYNPIEDLENEEWAKTMLDFKSKAPKQKESGKGEYETDSDEEGPIPLEPHALSCPACFREICSHCQPHETRPNQFRTLSVRNCQVDESEIIRAEGGREWEILFRVKCECGHAVGVYDFEEKEFHLLNVIP